MAHDIPTNFFTGPGASPWASFEGLQNAVKHVKPVNLIAWSSEKCGTASHWSILTTCLSPLLSTPKSMDFLRNAMFWGAARDGKVSAGLKCPG